MGPESGVSFQEGATYERRIDPKTVKNDHIPALPYGGVFDPVRLFVRGKRGCREEGAAFAGIARPRGAQAPGNRRDGTGGLT